jgi:hypothetical protein
MSEFLMSDKKPESAASAEKTRYETEADFERGG